jgi:preprotein translocase subunit SecB
MAESSVAAEFDFVSYKIDSVSFKMGNEVNYLLNTTPIKSEFINLSIKLRNTEKFIIDEKTSYIGGLITQVIILNEADGSTMVEGQFGISGLFTSNDSVDKQAEETFAKINLPALLMPYLRATMTNILSNAGFGTMLFPLVNIYELAKAQNLSIIDHTKKMISP